MKTLRLASAFNRDLKHIERRNYDRALLEAVVDALRAGEQLPRARRDRPLKGEWKGWRECHIQPDWLLIYKATATELLLARTGTHADLFGG
jgi:mRNA interferase YafQ